MKIDYTNALRKGKILYGADTQYCIERTLGQGSFGYTYMASLNVGNGVRAYVAIKEFFLKTDCHRNGNNVVYNKSDGKFDRYLKKFNKEVDHLSRLDNDGVVKVIDSFDANGTAYYVMEYLDGGSLDDYLEKHGAYSERAAVGMAIRIGRVLSYIHEKGILHLDLKPQNIMLRNGTEPVLIDFGLSKMYDPESGLTSTLTHELSKGYAPIEQYNYTGNGFPVTMDIHALGGTLYKMLCGQRPPEAPDVINNETIIASHLRKCGISADIVAVVEKAMKPRYVERYQSTGEMLSALMQLNSKKKPSEETVRETPKRKESYQKKQQTIKTNNTQTTQTRKKDEDSGIGEFLGGIFKWGIFIVLGVVFGFGPMKSCHKDLSRYTPPDL